MPASQPKKPRRALVQDSDDSANLNASLECIVYAGRVCSIQMVNFMCHSNLEISFNPRVNFISGRNGSGKSAVMAALVVVLGGTATNTQRGSSVSDFIKKGENSGRVTIELMNDGINAYNREEYGNRIHITRTFSRTNNSYIVKSASGEVISKKKKEVDKICQMLRLDVTNPICVLNQDVARSFLTSSDSRLRYELFMKATQLKELKNLHLGTVNELSEAFTDLERKSSLLEATKKEVQEVRKKLNYLKTLEVVTEERRNLENEFLWAGVLAEEASLQNLKDERKSIKDKLADIENNNNNHDSRMNELKEELNEIKNYLNEIISKKQKIIDEKRQIHEEVLKAEREINRFQSQMELSLPKLQRVMGDIQRVKESIDDVGERNNRTAAEHAQVQERIKIIQTELKNSEELYVAAERDMNNAEETKARITEKLRSLENLLRDVERNKNHKESQLEELRGQGDMNTQKFGAFVPGLLKAIDDADAKRQFHRKPVGPLGMYVKLDCDPKWGPAVESVIGNFMTSYCCDNDQDFRVLEKIMNQIVGRRQPSVIISKFQSHRHDVSQSRLSVPGFISVLDAISISDDTVFNTLVDQSKIEQILLFERDDQAAAMLTHIENVPSHLVMGVTLKCDKYYPAPNYRTYAGRVQSRFFDQSSRKEDVIKRLECSISELAKDLSLHAQEKRQCLEERKKMEDFGRKTQMRLREHREKRDKMKMELGQLKDLEESQPVPRTRLALEEELETLEQQRDNYESEREAKKQALRDIEDKKSDAKARLEKTNRKLDEIQHLTNEYENKISANTDAQNCLKFMRTNAQRHVDDYKEQLRSNEERKIVVEMDLKRCLKEAEDFCPQRINTTRSLKEISSILQKKEQYLKAAEKLSGTKEEIMAEYSEKKAAYEKKSNEHNEIADNITFFTNSVHHRMELFEEKRKLCAQEVSYNFRGSLRTRGYDGMLQFNFDAEQLELEVHPHRNEAGDKRQDAKTLSGGERSYSTVSFILAMWRAVAMPFYFMDEFDVFMDKVNRKVVMDLLLSYANDKTNTQFVFITPQDISSVSPSETISIFKMPDPERNNSAN